MVTDSKQLFSKTIAKGISILCLFDREHTRLSLSEISQKTGINKTSTYRFVNTFIELGFLKKNFENKLLKLGTNALLLGHNFIQGFDLLQITKPLIDKVFAEHHITIDSALLDGHKLFALYRREASNTVFFRQPLVSQDLYARALGKAVLSQFSQEALKTFLSHVAIKKHTSKTNINHQKIISELKISRDRGYSINNEEFMQGLICIGAPLMNYRTNSVVGAISFDFPSTVESLDAIERNYTGILTKLASEISEMITIADS